MFRAIARYLQSSRKDVGVGLEIALLPQAVVTDPDVLTVPVRRGPA
jgi:hypothetical protein